MNAQRTRAPEAVKEKKKKADSRSIETYGRQDLFSSVSAAIADIDVIKHLSRSRPGWTGLTMQQRDAFMERMAEIESKAIGLAPAPVPASNAEKDAEADGVDEESTLEEGEIDVDESANARGEIMNTLEGSAVHLAPSFGSSKQLDPNCDKEVKDLLDEGSGWRYFPRNDRCVQYILGEQVSDYQLQAGADSNGQRFPYLCRDRKVA